MALCETRVSCGKGSSPRRSRATLHEFQDFTLKARRRADDSNVTSMMKKPAGVMFVLGMIRNPVLEEKLR